MFKLSLINNFEELLTMIKSSDIQYNLAKIQEAYIFASPIMGKIPRKSGDTYMDHGVRVAGYAFQMKLDQSGIIAAMLHDIVEKGGIDIEEIDKRFGTEVAFIVDGQKSIQKITKDISEDQIDTENFKHLIFNSTEDIRVLIIRIIEKLDNLNNIANLDEANKQYSAKKALNVYAPLAEYMGLAFIQREIEDRAFQILKPEEYSIVSESVSQKYESSQTILQAFIDELSEILTKHKINSQTISSRKKGIYSTYKKWKRKTSDPKLTKEGILNLKDIIAARIIVDSIEDCYVVLGLIHANWEYVKEEFDDYISKPKESGYRSLQTAIVFKDLFLEIQIRTLEMHEYNEFGPASHIAYKLKSSGKRNNLSVTWTKDLTKWQDENSGEENYKIKIFAKSIFVFTPKGLIIKLDQGSHPLDFAFQVHTEIGYCYVGAKVNGKMVNMNFVLKTGDIVEILTAKKRNVTLDWLKFATMQETKSRIRRHFNNT